MKKKTLLALGVSALTLGIADNATAQTWTGAGTSMYPNPLTTKVGIGIVPTTADMLTVKGEIGLSPWSTTSYSNIYGRSSDRGLSLFANSDNSNGSGILLNANNLTNDNKGGLQYVASYTNGTNDVAHNFISISSGGAWDSKMAIRKDGKVGIGVYYTNITDMLTVKDNIGFSSTAGSYSNILGRSSDRGLSLFAGSDYSNGSTVLLNANNLTNDNKGGVQYVASYTNGSNDIAHNFISTASNGTWDSKMTIRKDGKVGIGVYNTNITDMLTLKGSIGFSSTAGSYNNILGRSSDRGLSLFAGSDYSNGGTILLNANNLPGDNRGGMQYVASYTTGGDDIAHNFISANSSGVWDSKMTIRKDGKVGIGVYNTNITDMLTVKDNIGFSATAGSYSNILGRSSDRGLSLFAGSDYGNGSTILLNANNLANDTKGGVQYVASYTSGADDIAHSFLSVQSNGVWDPKMTIRKDGIVVVGSVPVPNSNYKMIVEKGILTEKVRVAVSGTTDWADYVFADNYELKPLNEVETFVKENRHLPDVPSADDVVKDGIDMAKMDAKLLQKIEELTLYVINQQKQIDAQQQEILKLKNSKKR